MMARIVTTAMFFIMARIDNIYVEGARRALAMAVVVISRNVPRVVK
jgi:hypothetical protein